MRTKTTHGAATVLMCLLTALLATGCASGGSRARILVAMSSTGQLSVGGDHVKRGNVARRLKSLGGGPGTEIRVQIDTPPPSGQMAALTAELSRAGFRRVVFVTPRRATAETKARQEK